MVVIRADASVAMGTGHVMRMLALAQAYQDTGEKVVFVSVDLPANLKERLLQEKIEVQTIEARAGSLEDAEATTTLASNLGAQWIVLDGYHFSSEYQQHLKQGQARLMVMDDMAHLEHYHADMILNQNLHSTQLNYWYEPNTKLLLGTEYVLLRKEFWPFRGWQREFPDVARKVLVTLGGSDPKNVTGKILEALELVEAELEVVVVVGGANPHTTDIQARLATSKHLVRLERNALDMSPLLAWADICITASGSTVWEVAFMGSSGILVSFAKNQEEVGRALDKVGAMTYLGPVEGLCSTQLVQALNRVIGNPQLRQRWAEKGMDMVDGYGGARVAACLSGNRLWLRRATPEDMKLVWEWANDAVYRSLSFNTDAISWESHKCWYQKNIESGQSCLYIGLTQEGTPVGQVRFDPLDGSRAVVTISIAAEFRSQGFGKELLNQAIQLMCHQQGTETFVAYVKPQNLASLRMFERAGFSSEGKVEVQGQEAMVLSKVGRA